MPYITATQDDLQFKQGSFTVFYLDIDPPDASGKYDTGGGPLTISVGEVLVAEIRRIIPELKDVTIGWCVSASNCIYAPDGTELKGISGQRLYFFMKGAEQTNRVLQSIATRTAQSGYKFLKQDRKGRWHHRTLVDSQTGTADRKNYIGAPKLDDGLTQRKPEPITFEGSKHYLDADDVEGGEESFLEWAKRDEGYCALHGREPVKKKEKQVRCAWAKKRAKQYGGSASEWEKNARAQRWPRDKPIELDDGRTITLAEVEETPEPYRDQYCFDPFEPEEGPMRAIIRLSRGHAYVDSFLHGGRDYHATEDPEWEARIGRLIDEGDKEQRLNAREKARKEREEYLDGLLEIEIGLAVDAVETWLADPKGLPPMALIRTPPGSGKTHRMLKELAELIGYSINFYMQSHELLDEKSVEYQHKGGFSDGFVVRGRGAPDEQERLSELKHSENWAMCHRHEVAAEISQAGLPVFKNLCAACPQKDACGYLQQFQDIPEYAVRFLPHAYLPIEAMCGKGDFAIIDENPISALFGERQIDARLLKNKARLSRMADAPNRDQWADDGLEERDPEAIIERAADVLRASLRNGVSTAAIVGQ